MRDTRWKRMLIIAWACLLAFGIVYQAEVAEAAHSSCADVCNDMCESGCAVYGGAGGCGCMIVCEDGTSHRTICTL